MAQTFTLAADKRDLAVKPRSLREVRKVPAVCYGAGSKNENLQLEYQAFRKVFAAAGESSLIDLSIAGGAPVKVLVHEVTYDPVTDAFAHVDLLRVDMQKKITTHIPLKFEGVAPAIKTHGGIFTHNKTEITIRCLPGDLIHDIAVDISGLAELRSSLHVRDIVVDGAKLEILENPETIICSIAVPKTEAELEAELATPVGEAVSAEVKQEAEAEKAAAVASKESDKEKKGGEKK